MNLYLKHSLYFAVAKAIESSIQGLTSHQEPDLVASLVTNLPQKLSVVLSQYMSGVKFNIGGCFIHQKPIVEFCDKTISTKKPEIGDLLLIYKEVNRNGNRYNALLLQAKKTSNIYNSPVATNDKHQLALYTKWPKFRYCRAGILNGQERSICPKTVSTGAQYLLIDENFATPNMPVRWTFWCATPDDVLSASHSLAFQIVDLIEFQTGRPFIEKRQYMDHWSKMIWDLIGISASACFNRRHAGYRNQPRCAGNIINLLTEGVPFVNDNNNNNNNNDDTSGVSVLYIEADIRERGYEYYE